MMTVGLTSQLINAIFGSRLEAVPYRVPGRVILQVERELINLGLLVATS